jgi:hypothetical protein
MTKAENHLRTMKWKIRELSARNTRFADKKKFGYFFNQIEKTERLIKSKKP